MLPTPINNPLYGCKNQWLANANTCGIEPDAPEQDTPKPDAPEPDVSKPDTLEEYLHHWVTLAVGQTEHCEPEWKHVPLHMTSQK